MGQGYAIKMASDISEWPLSVTTVPNGVLDAISWTTPAFLGPLLGTPGKPGIIE